MNIEQDHRASNHRPVYSPSKKPGTDRCEELRLSYTSDCEPDVS
jgi:hypothetical protein